MADEDLNSTLPPLPPRYRFRDVILGDHFGDDDSDRVRVEFFTNERTLKERLQLYFVKNQRSSLRIRTFNFVIKLLTCVLYVVRVMRDNPKVLGAECHCGQSCANSSAAEQQKLVNETTADSIDWSVIFFVNRSQSLWLIQLVVAVVSLMETALVTYLRYKGNIWYNILAPSFLLELVNTAPFIVTIFSTQLRCLFVPVFLNCWLAKNQLEEMFADLNRVLQRTSSAVAKRLMTMTATTVCILFTSVCGIQHLQRVGERSFSLFQSLWFVIVTFSTVGYGDYTPDVWPSQLFMIAMICVAITVLPSQVEQLASTWIERKSIGENYSRHRAQNERHVVVCTTTLHSDTIMDFLNEFYAHPKLQDFYVILFSPCKLDSTLKIILQVPIWAQRVIYIQGSALKDADLARCRMQDAEACFILCPGGYQDRSAADQHTILRAWAVKDFAPQCPQFVQIYRPENKMHVKFSEYVVCEDEFKYAILSNNCLCPGTSTLVTLLLHTSRGQEGQSVPEPWVRSYGKCSGNEIYHVLLSDSRFFREYAGRSFTYASYHAHWKFGVGLVAVKTGKPNATLQLNPGPHHVMHESDTCYYLSITKEENTKFVKATPPPDKGLERGPSIRPDLEAGRRPSRRRSLAGLLSGIEAADAEQATRLAAVGPAAVGPAAVGPVALRKRDEADGDMEVTSLALKPQNKQQQQQQQQQHTLSVPTAATGRRRGSVGSVSSRRSSVSAVPACDQAVLDVTDYVDDDSYEDENLPATQKDYPPVLPYVGNTPCLSHILADKRPICCMNLAAHCSHCSHSCAKDYNWANRGIIVCADFASNGLYNFILPLRSYWLPKTSLKPIVLLLERQPDRYFLEAISHFPLIYWMVGSLDNIDDLLCAGILYSDSVVIVNKESSNSTEEDSLADCNTIIAVQTIFRLFPGANIITELSQSSNMRFTQFKANDSLQIMISGIEKIEKERGSHLSFMFRLGFASGSVFSASMLDTLLYQAFVKDYLLTFVRLLLGIDQADGSGHLTCMKITPRDQWILTYGRLYRKLCRDTNTWEVPIGIYKTFTLTDSEDEDASQPAVAPGRTGNSPSASSQRSGVGIESSTEQDDRRGIARMIRYRMDYLKMGHKDYDEAILQQRRDTVSYVIINPPADQKLEPGDIIFLIRPPTPKTSPQDAK